MREADRLAYQLSVEYGIPRSELAEYVVAMSHEMVAPPVESTLVEVSKRLNELVEEQIIYLPTYRRIEQDLKTIFPNIEIDHEKLHKRLSRQDAGNYIELVEFGMEDVDKNISDKMSQLKEFHSKQA